VSSGEPSRKRPSYQWYPGDWRRDSALQACSFMARAIWRELLDIMHDGEPRGYLAAGGRAIEPLELSRMIGGGLSSRKIGRALSELRSRNVYSMTEDGIIFSRRMVRDEAIIQARIRGGRDAEQPNRKGPSTAPSPLPSTSPSTPPLGAPLPQPPAVCSLQSASAAARTELPAPTALDVCFGSFWSVYPRKVAKGAARKAWDRLKPPAALVDRMLAAIARQLKSDQWQRDGGQFIPHPATWLNQSRWEDEPDNNGRGASGRTGAENASQYDSLMRGLPHES
jgi:hypothetical protein